MTKLSNISGNAMIKYLIKKGFIVKSRKGSHVTLKHNDLFTTVPAGNRMLKTGTLLAILQDVHITRNEFVNDFI